MKKILKITLYIILTLVVLWLVMFCIDYIRCSNLKMPFFVKANVTELAEDGGSGTYYGLLYKVEVKKYISAEFGLKIQKLEMYMFNRLLVASIE